ncbi:MAG: lytic murein transglycosylase, partial [Rhizomicrobium sp.]
MPSGHGASRTPSQRLGLALGFNLLVAGCASHITPPPAAPPGPAPLVLSLELSPEQRDFRKFIQDFRPIALAAGVTPATYDAALDGVSFNPHVPAHTVSQPEFVKPIWAYVDDAVLPRIATGKARIAENSALLAGLEARYGVPKAILVSIWGNETDFGKVSGHYNMFTALASLAYAGPRTLFARSQLIAALKMVDRQGLSPAGMTSSWAGAFGQTQFIPTSFLERGVDGDGDGIIDLWHSSADALASTANLLAAYGWQRGEPWGYEVTLPAGFSYETADLEHVHPLADWAARGVRKADVSALTGIGPGAIFIPAGAQGPIFLVLPNFRVVMKYNAAAAYALAVCRLADRIEGQGPLIADWPRNEPPMSKAQRITLQQALVREGFAVGVIDGVIGSNTRVAIRAYQQENGLPADGFASHALLLRLTGG